MKHDKQWKTESEYFMFRFMPVYLHSHICADAAPEDRHLPQSTLLDAIFISLRLSFILAHDDKADDIDDNGI